MKKITKLLCCAFLLNGLISLTIHASETDVASVTTEQIRSPASAACDNGKTYTIAYSHSLGEAAIVKQVRSFIDERAAMLGCVTVMHDNTQANNLEQQINALQGWITLGVDAIVVLPIDESALKPFQKQAQAKGIRWLTYLGTMSDTDGYVGFNHAQSGQIVAQAAVEWVKNKGLKNPKALVTTLTGMPSLKPRWEEVERIFTQAGIEIVATQDAADQTSGLKLAETVIKQHPDLNLIIGLNDDAAVGAYRAVKIAGLDPDSFFIAGQDGSLEGLTAINEGQAYKASAAILINELGYNVVDLALNAITGNGPDSAYTPTVLASKENQLLLDKLLANFNQ